MTEMELRSAGMDCELGGRRAAMESISCADRDFFLCSFRSDLNESRKNILNALMGKRSFLR